MRFGFRCPLRWDDLEGQGSVRRCGDCGRDVTDLRGLTADEARASLRGLRAPCVVATTDAEGGILFRARRFAQVASLSIVAGAPQCPAEAPPPEPVEVRDEAPDVEVMLPPDLAGVPVDVVLAFEVESFVLEPLAPAQPPEPPKVPEGPVEYTLGVLLDAY